MQAMTKGGVLTLQTDCGAEGVWVTVSDTGGGIPPEQINRIFEPFYTTKKKGTGLGLMIVQRIVPDHGGRDGQPCSLSAPSTFSLPLPLLPSTAPTPIAPPPGRRSSTTPRLIVGSPRTRAAVSS